MKAKKMFEALGYKIKCNNDYELRYSRGFKKTKSNVHWLFDTFDLGHDIRFLKYSEQVEFGRKINKEYLLAIRQQMIELGWCDDEK